MDSWLTVLTNRLKWRFVPKGGELPTVGSIPEKPTHRIAHVATSFVHPEKRNASSCHRVRWYFCKPILQIFYKRIHPKKSTAVYTWVRFAA
jgi:hypothetical protein